MIVVLCLFFKQKTAYEMRISDWSSDVCSSDLAREQQHDQQAENEGGLAECEQQAAQHQRQDDEDDAGGARAALGGHRQGRNGAHAWAPLASGSSRPST